MQKPKYFLSKFHINIFLIIFLFLNAGCAGLKKTDTINKVKDIGNLKINEFFLSPRDEINITVFEHDNLTRKIAIPSDGMFDYPIVGTVDVNGKSLRQLKEIITKGLSEYKEQLLMPKDKISISVFRHDELSRSITIPPDGYIFFPLVGEIKAEGKSLRELREIIVSGLIKYKKAYIVPGDQISIIIYKNEDLSRKLIIPPDGYFFFPFVGEINAIGKNLRDLRLIILKGLSDDFEDTEVAVDLLASIMPKIVIDPQVSVDITKLSKTKRIVDPEVSIEVTKFGGHKIFILGEVKQPGVYLTDGNVRIIEAILSASGLTPDAEQKSVLLIRGGIDNQKPELIVVNLEKVFKKGDLTQNKVLQQGDIIYVPRTFISDVDRFFTHLSTIISPFLRLETGYFIGQQILNSTGAASVGVQ